MKCPPDDSDVISSMKPCNNPSTSESIFCDINGFRYDLVAYGSALSLKGYSAPYKMYVYVTYLSLL